MGSGDFTVDCWIKRGATGRGIIIAQGDSGGANSGITLQYYSDDKLLGGFGYNSGANVVTASFGTALTDTASWHHVALIRNGNNMYVAQDGVLSSATDVTGLTADDVSTKMAIGRPGEYNGFYFNGWIDEMRVSKGIARWTSNFTPPTLPYGPSTNKGGGFLSFM